MKFVLALVLALVAAAMADVPTPRPNIPAVDPDVSVIFTSTEWLALFVFVTLWYTHPFGFDWRYYVGSHYKKRVEHMRSKHKVRMVPVLWLGLCWFILYGFVAAGVFIFWRNFPTTSAIEIAIWSLIFANYFLNKGWGLVITIPGAGFTIFGMVSLVFLSAAAVATLGYIEKAYWLAAVFTGYAAFVGAHLYFMWYYWSADVHVTKKERPAAAGSGETEYAPIRRRA